MEGQNHEYGDLIRTADRIIEYELYFATPPLFALDQYDSRTKPQADLGLQRARLARICRPANSLGEKLTLNAMEYSEHLSTGLEPNEPLEALRWRSAQTLTDALSRVVGIHEAISVMLERNNGEHNLLEASMSLYAKRDSASGLMVLDTGQLSYEQYVSAVKEDWSGLCRNVVDRSG